ncbi:MAG: adenosine deaminase [Anaerolineales bacterium]|nr:adenosine deaminase [Anaerolineales bacterium]MCX7754389.1 adenosine deaminase [Anaerolineales bacterium]MDW8277911.1 adenosine deaminase [Anaerolineales bacterium]
MSSLFTPAPDEFRRLPKVDLHRHLEGSLRLQTMLDVARKHGMTMPANVVRLSRLVQVQDEDNFTFDNFLSKFNTLRMFYRSPEVIERITYEAVEDAAKDNVRYMELRFTPVALSRAERFPLEDVTDWVCKAAREAEKKYKVIVRLIASVNRHEPLELAEQVAWIAVEKGRENIVGLDLAGNEAEYPAAPFIPLFNEARQAGLRITLHAGEWAGPQNVREAIEKFSAERIGHGVRVLEDDFTTALAREHGTAFEVCLTSNYQTGVVKSLASHPAPQMLAKNLNITFNTDDPSISQITLSNEYRVAVEELKIPRETLKERIIAAAQASFLPEGEKKKLVESLRKELSKA